MTTDRMDAARALVLELEHWNDTAGAQRKKIELIAAALDGALERARREARERCARWLLYVGGADSELVKDILSGNIEAADGDSDVDAELAAIRQGAPEEQERCAKSIREQHETVIMLLAYNEKCCKCASCAANAKLVRELLESCHPPRRTRGD